eukprot:scaffold295646_cov17-Tisochrysis_lutea.AAC.1
MGISWEMVLHSICIVLWQPIAFCVLCACQLSRCSVERKGKGYIDAPACVGSLSEAKKVPVTKMVTLRGDLHPGRLADQLWLVSASQK